MRVYKFYYFVLLFSILFFTNCSKKNEISFSISGKISELKNKFLVLSKVEDIQKKTTIIVDTIWVTKKGEFSSEYFLQPNIYNLRIGAKTIILAIDKGQNIVINGNMDNLTVNGSVDTQLLNEYECFRKESLNRLVFSVRNKIKELKKENNSENKIIKLRELEVENYKKHLDELLNFVKEKMGTSIAIYPTSLRWSGGKNLPFLQLLVNTFEEKYPNLEITKKMKLKLLLLERTSVGSTISNIEMPDVTNKIIQLNNVKGKYTLIDFWASWCPPCRTESVLLNELYSAYNSKGFEIYGISLDSKRDRWIKAIEKDKRIWTEVSTTEGFKTPVSIEYGITALPTNFLIDATGKIIAVNIHGKHLKEKIEELFE